MTSIKAPFGPTGPSGLGGPEAPSSNTPSTGAVFREALHPTTGAPADQKQGVLSDLSAGKITPNQAVERLTTIAVEKSGCPESARPVVEQRIRRMLSQDPVVGSLLRQIGAGIPPDGTSE